MAKARIKSEVSPRGIFVYPRLTKPDFEYKSCGEYSVKLKVSAGDAAELMGKIDVAVKTNFEAESNRNGKKVKQAELPYSVDEETGDILFTFRRNATFEDKDSGETRQSPVRLKSNTMVDGKLEDFPEGVDIWGGTVGRIAFQIFPYCFKGKCGVRLNMSEAKILKLVTGASESVFGDEDADFVDESEDASDVDSNDAEYEAAEDASGADF